MISAIFLYLIIAFPNAPMNISRKGFLYHIVRFSAKDGDNGASTSFYNKYYSGGRIPSRSRQERGETP